MPYVTAELCQSVGNLSGEVAAYGWYSRDAPGYGTYRIDAARSGVDNAKS